MADESTKNRKAYIAIRLKIRDKQQIPLNSLIRFAKEEFGKGDLFVKRYLENLREDNIIKIEGDTIQWQNAQSQ